MLKVFLVFISLYGVCFGETRASRSYSSSYTLYTRDNPQKGESVQGTSDSVWKLRINGNTNYVIIVHGTGGSSLDNTSLVLRDAFLSSGPINVIVVDWSETADSSQASDAVPAIAANIITLIKFMHDFNKGKRERLHLVGFDLGAHIVGNVGRAYKEIARITALNPYGGDNWSWNQYRLKNTDASYVEVIHTEITSLGLHIDIGDVDFYVNGGSHQPGCKDISCSHHRSWQIFAASITHGSIIGFRCPDSSAAQSKKTACNGFNLPLGTTELSKYGSGSYRLDTNSAYPYRCKIKCGLVDTIIEIIEGLSSADKSL